MKIETSRVYESKMRSGYRVLVDRLWPRGLSKQRAALDEWCKELAPTPELRKWFDHDPAKWTEFSKRYRSELTAHRQEAQSLLSRAQEKTLILLYGAKDEQHAHVRVLEGYLRQLKPANVKRPKRSSPP
jgi:uncharacterized protein YeaO (DUF488 family)